MRMADKSIAEIFHNERSAWVVLAMSLIVTALAWYISSEYAERRAEDRFHFEVEDARQRIVQRMQHYVQALRSGVGLFDANPQAGREEWRSFVTALRIHDLFPGIQGLGFSRMIAPSEKAAHEREVRAEGFPDYSIYPDGDRAQYSSIVYLEPFSGRNLRAFGYDMYSEPVRRVAMDAARDTGEAAVSGRVTLVQETNEDIQTGFLAYLPVYRAGLPTDTLEARRAALLGYVYSPFRVRDLMRGILGQDPAGLDFALYDGSEIAPQALLYDSASIGPDGGWGGHVPRFTTDIRIELPGRTWTARFSSRPVFEAANRSSLPLLVGLGGLLIDVLLFAIISSLSSQKRLLATKARELEASEAALALREARYRAVIETSPDGFCILDEQGRLQEVNEAYCRRSGYQREELLRMSVPELEAREASEEMGIRIAKIMQRGYDRFESRHRAKDGTLWPVEVTVSHDAGSGAVFVFARDISKRKALEEQLHRKAGALAENDRRKDEFLAMLGHELRNPLAPIVNSVHVLEIRRAALPEDVRWCVEVIARQAGQMRRLVDDLLDVARIARGRIDLQKEPVELVGLVSAAIDMHHPRVAARGQHLEVALPREPIYMDADPVRLAQVIDNLLTNAIKYTPEGGCIWLEMEAEGAEACIRVRDDGIGIPADLLPQVFEPFVQADHSLDRSQGGLGLGLGLVRGLVEMHGGRVAASSPGRGQGSEFVVRLPIGQTTPGASGKPARQAVVPCRVLIVDDNVDLAASLAFLLRELGCEAETVHDGPSALAAVERLCPDVVLLDIGLPGMDGYEVARRIRARGLGVLLVALTGYGQEKDRERARQAGFDLHLLKPADVLQLQALLDEVADASDIDPDVS
jgi:PAS domain S-box-containing protein